MDKKVYRIEIGAEKFWIGPANQLVRSIDIAVPVTHDDHMWVMENLGVPATAYNDSMEWSKRQSNDALPTDHSKIAHKLVLNFHSDASHGWLAVKLSLVRELGLAGKISQYSYMQGKTAYLEEDGDAVEFIKAFLNRFGFEPKIKDLDSKNYSPIRSFKRFKMEA